MRPRVAKKVRQSVPWPLIKGDLHSVIVTEVLVRDVVDRRQVWELPEVRSVQVLARGAAGGRGSDDLRRGVGRITQWAGQPAGTRRRRIDVIQTDQSRAVRPHICDLQREIIRERVLKA